jgi:hypothetical protein
VVLIACMIGGLAVGLGVDWVIRRSRDPGDERNPVPPGSSAETVTERLRTVHGVPSPPSRHTGRETHFGDAVSPRDTGLGKGRSADMPTRGTSAGSGQSRAAGSCCCPGTCGCR